MTPVKHRPRWRGATVAFASALIIILALVAFQRSTTGFASGSRSGASTDQHTPLTLTSTDGRPVTVPGSRPTLLFFMAWWCASCIVEGRALQAIEAEYDDRVEFIAVEVTPDAAGREIAQFQAQVGSPQHPYVVDRRGDLVDRYDVTALDTTLLVAPDGDVLARVNGDPLDEGELRSFIEDALDG